jgi:mono/diheme cytochrome c family protein
MEKSPQLMRGPLGSIHSDCLESPALSRGLKWIGLSLGGLIAVLVVVGLSYSILGWTRLHGTVVPPPGLRAVPTDSTTLARGQHLLRIYGCQDCHGADLSGRVFPDIPPGQFVAPNLTRGRGGIGATFQAADWDRAIRFGVRPDHTSLVPVMPYRLFNHLSDADATALIAYLERVPPVDHLLPPTTIHLLGYFVAGFADRKRFFGDRSRPAASAPARGTAAYGAYIASTICADCHGAELQGGKHPEPDAPPAPSLLPAAYWPEPTFAATVRTGIAPGNRKLNEWMPARRLQYLTDDELEAVYAYLQTLKLGTTPR